MEDNTNEIPEKLIKIIMKHSAFERNEIQLDTSLNTDYRGGMSHYDAVLFFNDLCDLYKIKFPKDFDVQKYFYTEGFEIPKFIKKLLGISISTEFDNKSITVGHIMKVINEKKWIEPTL